MLEVPRAHPPREALRRLRPDGSSRRSNRHLRSGRRSRSHEDLVMVKNQTDEENDADLVRLAALFDLLDYSGRVEMFKKIAVELSNEILETADFVLDEASAKKLREHVGILKK